MAGVLPEVEEEVDEPEEAEVDELAERTAVEKPEPPRTSDPVRLYLREADVRQRRRFLQQLARVRAIAAEWNALVRRRASAARRARAGQRLATAVCGLGLNRRQIERIKGGVYAAFETLRAPRERLRAY